MYLNMYNLWSPIAMSTLLTLLPFSKTCKLCSTVTFNFCNPCLSKLSYWGYSLTGSKDHVSRLLNGMYWSVFALFFAVIPCSHSCNWHASEKHNHLLQFELQRSGVINSAKDFLHSRVAQRPFDFESILLRKCTGMMLKKATAVAIKVAPDPCSLINS